ncbi:MAG: KTSC domain-containing protein [Bacteroidia bacterium]
MKRISVESSMISSIGYEASTKTLEIEFNTGAIWQYADFPKDLWDKFKNCKSYGRFFLEHIQDFYADTKIARKRN